MQRHSVGYQALVLTTANALVRALGFLLRVLTGRLLGAQALGVMELGHSAHMLSIAPLTAGLPMAVSCVTARQGDRRALSAGCSLVRRLCCVLIPAWLLLSPVICALLGDLRALPSLWVFTPCMLVLGLSAVYNGYCYGRGNSLPPALSELLEQVTRLALTVGILAALPHLTVAGRAAVPCLATLLAEIAGLLLMRMLLRREESAAFPAAEAAVRRELWRLSLPLTASRLLATALRALNNAVIPRRLMASGLTGAAATAQLGMLQGMVMPVLFLPGIFTGALGVVGAPAVARSTGRDAHVMGIRLYAGALVCGLAGMAGIRALSGVLAEAVYGESALRALFDQAAPLTVVFALQQATNAVLNGLGEQRRTLLPQVLGAALTLALLYWWTAQTQLAGAIHAMQAGQTVTLLLSMFALLCVAAKEYP